MPSPLMSRAARKLNNTTLIAIICLFWTHTSNFRITAWHLWAELPGTAGHRVCLPAVSSGCSYGRCPLCYSCSMWDPHLVDLNHFVGVCEYFYGPTGRAQKPTVRHVCQRLLPGDRGACGPVPSESHSSC